MCLSKLEDFTPAKVGYQVKHKNTANLDSVIYDAVFYRRIPGQQLGGTYEARRTLLNTKTHRGKLCYVSGFHVFHRLSDARKYRDVLEPHQKFVVVKVKTGGEKTTGLQIFTAGKLGGAKYKVTVCNEVTLLHEVE